MGVETITSRSNPLMSHIRKLVSSGAHRRKSGEFVCDGRKLLGEAQQWHVPVSAVVFCDGEKPPEVPGARLVQVRARLSCSGTAVLPMEKCRFRCYAFRMIPIGVDSRDCPRGLSFRIRA